MIKVGITGQGGFIGNHLYLTLGLYPDQFTRVPFEKEFYESQEALQDFVAKCDVIVHLAGVNRHESEEALYKENARLASELVEALKSSGSKAAVIFSSSVQEDRDNNYGNAKKEARRILSSWARANNSAFFGCLIPNVFGPFGRPFYNSVVATFCHLLTHGGKPEIQVDGQLSLIYVHELVAEFLTLIRRAGSGEWEEELRVQATSIKKVSEILTLLENYRELYLENGQVPTMSNTFERNLFNTFRSYIEHQDHFPVKFVNHVDNRGSFTELVRTGIGGQSSFSITKPGITRGNHFHTRKIERFSVIKGEAIIRLRKTGTDKVIVFHLDSSEPAYVDMPIWYTHNITNVGEDELCTMFWINEFYDPQDPDTWIEKV